MLILFLSFHITFCCKIKSIIITWKCQLCFLVCYFLHLVFIISFFVVRSCGLDGYVDSDFLEILIGMDKYDRKTFPQFHYNPVVGSTQYLHQNPPQNLYLLDFVLSSSTQLKAKVVPGYSGTICLSQ